MLGKVAEDCQLRGEPSLTALCVHQDETVGVGYAYVLKIAGEQIPDDLDFHAAEARLACYRAFGADLPAGGGQPALTAEVAAARRHKAKQIELMPALCHRCFIQLPFSGCCDDCD